MEARNKSVQRKRNWVVAIAVACGLLMAPALADAKAGGGSSIGSRGSKTFQPNAGKPIERSITPPPSAAAPVPPVSQPTPVAPPRMDGPPPRQGFFQRHPLVGGLLGGLAGAGIGAMLFGGNIFGGGGMGGILSVLLQVALVFFLARWAYGFFRRRAGQSAPLDGTAGSAAAGPAAYARPDTSATARNPVNFALSEIDLATFERLLVDIQTAWSHGDVAALRRLTTPEISGFLEEQLRDNGQRGQQNLVEQVHLTKGDVNETWHEGPLDYATVTLTWTAVDYTVRTGGTEVIAGDPRVPVSSTEIWTLVRRAKEPWQLSAIQQV